MRRQETGYDQPNYAARRLGAGALLGVLAFSAAYGIFEEVREKTHGTISNIAEGLNGIKCMAGLIVAVESGDTVDEIAREYGNPGYFDATRNWMFEHGAGDAEFIHPGDELVVPFCE